MKLGIYLLSFLEVPNIIDRWHWTVWSCRMLKITLQFRKTNYFLDISTTKQNKGWKSSYSRFFFTLVWTFQHRSAIYRGYLELKQGSVTKNSRLYTLIFYKNSFNSCCDLVVLEFQKLTVHFRIPSIKTISWLW